MPFGTEELWRVNFTAPLSSVLWSRAAPERVTLINVDTISCAGSVVTRSNFTDTGCQLGRFKSPGGALVGNRFLRGEGAYNLEFSALSQWLEGPVWLEGITVADNIFVAPDDSARLSLHCGPRCEAECARASVKKLCMAVSDTADECPACPNCSAVTPWAQLNDCAQQQRRCWQQQRASEQGQTISTTQD
jgi:hypothetical protein